VGEERAVRSGVLGEQTIDQSSGFPVGVRGTATVDGGKNEVRGTAGLVTSRTSSRRSSARSATEYDVEVSPRSSQEEGPLMGFPADDADELSELIGTIFTRGRDAVGGSCTRCSGRVPKRRSVHDRGYPVVIERGLAP
jgi:hypothetical protein